MVLSNDNIKKQALQNTSEGQASSKKPIKKSNETLVPVFRVKIGDKIYDSSKGELLTEKHPPYVWNSTRRISEARFVLDDPDSKIFKTIQDKEQVEVEVGFTNGSVLNKFIGLIHKYGRVLPRGTIITALDKSAQQNTQVGASTMKSNNGNAATTSTTGVQPANQADSSSGGQVVSTFTGIASYYGNNDGTQGGPTASGEKFNTNDLTAAHPSLPFNTKVRVTNVKNGKSVVVRINDRGPYTGGRVIDLSVAAATAIAMIEDGHTSIKGEVLSATGVGVSSSSTAVSTNAPKTTAASAPTDKTTLKSGAATVSTSSGNTFTLSEKASLFKTPESTTISLVRNSGANLKLISDSNYININEGTATLQRSQAQVANIEAALHGDVIITSGNTVKEVSPNKVPTTNIVVDYKTNPSIFLGYPTITKKTSLQIQSGLGSTTVQGYNINEKQSIAATAVNPVQPTPVASGTINVPEWGQLKMSDPIIPGSMYTWGDATKGGSRVPASKQVMQGIVQIAQLITPLTEKTVGKGKKWQINSWYRDPSANAACGGASRSRHLVGDAVDFSYPGYMSLWPELQKTWQGGYAIKPGSFIHLDCGPHRTWVYS